MGFSTGSSSSSVSVSGAITTQEGSYSNYFNSLASVGAGATATYQPTAGTGAVIISCGGVQRGTAPSNYIDLSVALYNGTNAGYICQQGTPACLGNMRLFADNTNYLQITNNNGSAQFCFYCGFTLG
jgi:hypothetical protein